MRFIRDNYKPVLWGVALVVLIAGALWAGMFLKEYRGNKASELLYKARKLQPGSDQQLAALQKVADDYTSTGSGKIAMFMYGEALFEKKDYEGALKEFEQLSNKTPRRPFLKVAAMHKMAESQYAMGKIEDAAKTYLEAALVPKNEIKDDSLYQAARCYEDMKDFAQAETLYRKIMDTSKDDQTKFRAEERLLWLFANGSISR